MSVYLKRLLESQQLSLQQHHPEDDEFDDEIDPDFDSKSNPNANSNANPNTNANLHRKRRRNTDHQNILLPRLYLLISKYDLSDEPILSDIQIHKFCKSNCIRAFARISSKLDRRSEMLEIFGKFSEDIIKHLPTTTPYHILQEENDRFRYHYAIRRMQRNKIKQRDYEEKEANATDTVFDLRLHSIKTFKWHSSPQAMDDEQKEIDSQSYSQSPSHSHSQSPAHSPSSRGHHIRGDRRVLAQNKLRETEGEAKRVLVAMRESIKLQRIRTLRDAKEYQRNLLKLKAMNQQRQEMEYQHPNDEDNLWQNESKIIGGGNDKGRGKRSDSVRSRSEREHPLSATRRLFSFTSG